MNLPKKSSSRYTQEAKVLSKQDGISHSTALNQIARSEGFANWKALSTSIEKLRVNSPPTPSVSKKFLADEDVSLDVKDLTITERSDDLDEDVKLNVIANKKYFASIGVKYSIFEPTETGLKKSILDATRQVRVHFELEKFHFFYDQKTGIEFKLIKTAYLISANKVIETRVSLYRPTTKNGDPRMWFSKLSDFAYATDQVAIVVFNGALYLFNFSRMSVKDITPQSEFERFFTVFLRNKNSVAEDLLAKLKEIAKNSIKSVSQGDTSIGMAIELALGIPPNSKKTPDYHGIELKGGRGGKNRSTLFAQVADWDKSECKSSADILDRYGYQREVDFKLYCTISTQKINSQGLKFFYNESTDQLIEKDISGKNVAIWPGDLLRTRLLEKHAETFWIDAESFKENGIEYFNLISVTHTKEPLDSQLLPLIDSGVVTMDHLIKRKGGATTTVSEKGPLFKINKKDLPMLFPEPKKYSLKD